MSRKPDKLTYRQEMNREAEKLGGKLVEPSGFLFVTEKKIVSFENLAVFEEWVKQQRVKK